MRTAELQSLFDPIPVGVATVAPRYHVHGRNKLSHISLWFKRPSALFYSLRQVQRNLKPFLIVTVQQELTPMTSYLHCLLHKEVHCLKNFIC